MKWQSFHDKNKPIKVGSDFENRVEKQNELFVLHQGEKETMHVI